MRRLLSMREGALRRRAQRQGYIMRKSRRAIGYRNNGDYVLIDADTNFVALGYSRCGGGFPYNATLEDIAEFLDGE